MAHVLFALGLPDVVQVWAGLKPLRAPVPVWVFLPRPARLCIGRVALTGLLPRLPVVVLLTIITSSQFLAVRYSDRPHLNLTQTRVTMRTLLVSEWLRAAPAPAGRATGRTRGIAWRAASHLARANADLAAASTATGESSTNARARRPKVKDPGEARRLRVGAAIIPHLKTIRNERP